jgi:hypothetical protein
MRLGKSAWIREYFSIYGGILNIIVLYLDTLEIEIALYPDRDGNFPSVIG